MPLHPLTYFEMQMYDQKEPKFNGFYSRNDLPKIKDGTYVIRTHWIALYMNAENVTYFDSFGVKHIPKEIRKFIRNKNITTNIYRIKAYDSIMWGYFCIGFIDFMVKDKSLLEHTNFFCLMIMKIMIK